jgi:uncharacterized membrane protein
MPANDRGVFVAAQPADINNTELAVRSLVEQLAIENISDVGDDEDVHVRQILPNEDLQSGDDNGYNGTDRVFEQTGLAADTVNETYEVDSDLKADDKVVAIFGVTNVAADPKTTELVFESGTGGIIERQNIQGLLTDPEDTLLFTDPLVFGATQDGVINQYTESAGDDGVVFHGVVAEPTGKTISESNRFESNK